MTINKRVLGEICGSGKLPVSQIKEPDVNMGGSGRTEGFPYRE